MADRQEVASTIEWWLRPVAWVFSRRPHWREACGRLMLRSRDNFYVLLALAFILAGAWDQFIQPFDKQLSRASFDWLMNHRLRAYHADDQITVLDIDEASLSAMAKDFGRWPWPRRVLADVASEIEAGGAQALMFDILFSDPDVSNPESEAAFDRYVARSRNTFFPIVRLNPANDASSRITLSMLNFAQPDPAVATSRRDPTRTVSMLPPYLKSIYDTTRVGTNNIKPDEDNVVRWYPNFEEVAGYRIPSLPYRMAQVLNWPIPLRARSLLNWPTGATPYREVRFIDAYRAAQRGDSQYFAQFRDKVVLIGSTAISLNDSKATPVARLHPGIDLLATAIDNTKNRSFLLPLPPMWLWVLEVLILSLSARLFWGRHRATAVTKYFFLIPGALLAVSMISISVSNVLLDLSVPTGLALAYFTIAKLFETKTHDYIAGTGIFSLSASEAGPYPLEVACLPANVPRSDVLRLLVESAVPIRLWEPTNTGLGHSWMQQGWVLWRRRPSGTLATAGGAPAAAPLEWQPVPEAEPATDPFALAHIIARSGAKANSGRTSSIAPSAESK